MYTRYSKIAFVWAIALYALLVVCNNLTDYGSNYQFVAHVLKMDTTFPDNRGDVAGHRQCLRASSALLGDHPGGGCGYSSVLVGRGAAVQGARGAGTV